MSLWTRLTTRNVGPADRLIRTLPVLIVSALWATGRLEGTLLVVLGVLSVMLLFTALTGRCSIYTVLGLSTCKNRAS